MALPCPTPSTAPRISHLCVLSLQKPILLLEMQHKCKRLSRESPASSRLYRLLQELTRKPWSSHVWEFKRESFSFPPLKNRSIISFLGIRQPGLPCESKVFLALSWRSSIHRKPWPGSRSVSHCLCGMRMCSAFSE